METPSQGFDLEGRIAEWRAYLLGRKAIHDTDADELEDHLRSQIDALSEQGLAPDEAFLVAVKRIGGQDKVTREFAREHSDRLWKQLVAQPDTDGQPAKSSRTEALVVIGLAIVAALAMKSSDLLGLEEEAKERYIFRNVSFFALPCLIGYFAWKRKLQPARCLWMAAAFVGAAACANLFPFAPMGATEVLVGLHLPIALWLPVGFAYTGGRWNSSAERMNFVRFSGELVIYYVLIALGGGALTGLSAGLFRVIGIDIERFAVDWIIMCGSMGAIIVAASLVELKKSVVENMAPVLTRLFAPMLTILLLALLATMAWTGNALDLDREVLISFNVVLMLVVVLLLYALSAREPLAEPGAFDIALLVLVVSALVLDAVLLTAISARIIEYGTSANKLAALAENLILLVNLAWSARLYFQFIRRRGSFAALERWQTSYLPVYSIWAGILVIVFPPLFGFV